MAIAQQTLGNTQPLRNEVRLSTVLLVAIGTFDLVTTLMWMNSGFMEGNPIFAAIAAHGSIFFALCKLVFLFGPVLILEFARNRKPMLADCATWFAICAYLGLYGGHLIQLGKMLQH